MNIELTQKLKNWRAATAKSEGVDVFRVLSNGTIEAIAETKPKSSEELMAIKGIKQKKFNKYGQDILALVSDLDIPSADSDKFEDSTTCSVSQYFKHLNSGLKQYPARILAEVSSYDSRNGHLFFSLKDKIDNSVLSCFMWKSDYDLCGIDLEIGMEVIADGFPKIYEPSGRLSFQTKSIELVGEGALKVAYDKLKNQLTSEGLFEEIRKKKIPDFPQKIGIITSRQGAVIEDFLNNLGKHGYQIELIDSRVEGQRAIKELLSALNRFERVDLDVLVIIRGGGSMESLMAFDNETLVRKIADYPIPVIAGIGHHKDVPLVALVADIMVSTPTATTKILNKSWDEASVNCDRYKNNIFYYFSNSINNQKSLINRTANIISDGFGKIFNRFNLYQSSIRTSLVRIEARLSAIINNLSNYSKIITDKFANQLLNINEEASDRWNILLGKYHNTILSTKKDLNYIWKGSVSQQFKNIADSVYNQLDNAENLIRYNDPRRQIALGYSIVRSNGAIIRNISDGKIGEEINIQTIGGTIDSTITKINKE